MCNLSSQKVKKYQRYVNKRIRNINKAIEKDNLWRGRFIIHQVESFFIPFQDKGGTLYLVLEIIDKSNGLKRLCFTDHFSIDYIGATLNEFIVSEYHADAWNRKKEPNKVNPYKDTTDYTSIPDNKFYSKRKENTDKYISSYF